MIRKILAGLLAALAMVCYAASIDVNKATQAELESIKGIGPSISGKILDERRKGAFKDWQDMIDRVKGVGENNAAKFSTEGLTVNGAPFRGATPAAKKDDHAKTAPATATKAPAATTAAPAATTAAADAKKTDKPMSADEKKAAAKKQKEEEKQAKKAAKADQAKAADAKASEPTKK